MHRIAFAPQMRCFAFRCASCFRICPLNALIAHISRVLLKEMLWQQADSHYDPIPVHRVTRNVIPFYVMSNQIGAEVGRAIRAHVQLSLKPVCLLPVRCCHNHISKLGVGVTRRATPWFTYHRCTTTLDFQFPVFPPITSHTESCFIKIQVLIYRLPQVYLNQPQAIKIPSDLISHTNLNLDGKIKDYRGASSLPGASLPPLCKSTN